MLFVDDITKIVRLGIASSFLKDEVNYLNLMLLGDPEVGKTTILTSFNFDKLHDVFVLTDFTRTVLEKFLKELSGNPKCMKYIIVPDFTRIKSHGKSTEKGIIGVLNSGIEEGIREVTTHITGGISDTKVFDKPKFFGIATSMTRQTMGDRRRAKYWYDIGFFSRFLPVSFSYTEGQRKLIRNYLAEGKDLMGEKEVLKLRERRILCQPAYVNQLNVHIDRLIEATHLYGFRYTKQFRIMLKANALLRDEKTRAVEQIDVEQVSRLMRYINLDYNEVQ